MKLQVEYVIHHYDAEICPKRGAFKIVKLSQHGEVMSKIKVAWLFWDGV